MKCFYGISECPSEIIEDDANFRVFLTVNARCTFSWNGNLQQRKLELNWTPPPDGVQNGDWISLFRRFRRRGSRVSYGKCRNLRVHPMCADAHNCLGGKEMKPEVSFNERSLASPYLIM